MWNTKPNESQECAENLNHIFNYISVRRKKIWSKTQFQMGRNVQQQFFGRKISFFRVARPLLKPRTSIWVFLFLWNIEPFTFISPASLERQKLNRSIHPTVYETERKLLFPKLLEQIACLPKREISRWSQPNNSSSKSKICWMLAFHIFFRLLRTDVKKKSIEFKRRSNVEHFTRAASLGAWIFGKFIQKLIVFFLSRGRDGERYLRF